MNCQKCLEDFKERDIDEHHNHPRFMDNKKGDGKKSYLCKKCHNILHLLLPTVLWKYIKEEDKESCINDVIKFTERWINGGHLC